MPEFVPSGPYTLCGRRGTPGAGAIFQEGKQGQADGDKTAPKLGKDCIHILAVKRSQEETPAWHTGGLDLNQPVAKGTSSISCYKMEDSMQLNI